MKVKEGSIEILRGKRPVVAGKWLLRWKLLLQRLLWCVGVRQLLSLLLLLLLRSRREKKRVGRGRVKGSGGRVGRACSGSDGGGAGVGAGGWARDVRNERLQLRVDR